ncbi:MAG: RluA family pseudouridine synthase [Isosphaeraceae bacterium]|nr:RluA family pseudouridine synthase [Isosphaeraceae bacterium]
MTEALSILWEDEHLLVVDKPAGLLTQPRGPKVGEPSLEDRVRAHLAPGAPTEVYLGTIHRLDRPVSGVIAWAKNPRSARRLAMQFERRSVMKTYAAVLDAREGTRPDVLPDRGDAATWIDGLGPVGPSGRAVVGSPEDPESKRAETRVRRLESAVVPLGFEAVLLEPLTGRTHQLRAQAAARGLPIAGDRAYGSSYEFDRGIALHARSLELHHPALERRMTFVAPWPEAWRIAGFAIDDSSGLG